MCELILITKEGSTKVICGSLDEAADRVKETVGLVGYRCFEVSGRKRKTKKKKFERRSREEKESDEQADSTP